MSTKFQNNVWVFKEEDASLLNKKIMISKDENDCYIIIPKEGRHS